MAYSLTVPARRALPLALGLGLAVLSLSPASAQTQDPALAAEIAALRAELERLQARVSELEARGAAAAGVALPAGSGGPGTTEIDAGPGLEIADESVDRSFGIGGRLHYDFYAHSEGARAATGGSEFRRARVNFDGEAAGWNYRLQVELSGDAVDLRDVYVERALGVSTLTLGQFKPHRSMEELGSSNDLSVMERGYTSASGLFADRQWQQGAGLLTPLRAGSLGVSVFTLREDDTARNEGWGASARATWAPLREDTRVLHFGLWGSEEQGGRNTPAVDIGAAYAGRRGPTALIFESAAGRDFEQRSAGLEFAGRVGAFHWQSEWSRARIAGPLSKGEIDAAYLQAGWVFGGGGREYELDEGLFGDMQDIGSGRWEAVARVDRILLRDNDAIEARRVVLGLNRYFNDELRLMLNWVRGEDRSIDDRAGQVGLRLQYVF